MNSLCDPSSRSARRPACRGLDTHRKGRIGSPIVAGSSNRCKCSSSVGSLVVNRGLPPPLRRTFLNEARSASLSDASMVLRADLRHARRSRDPTVPRGLRLGRRVNRRPPRSGEERRASYRMRRGDSSIIKRYRRWPPRQEIPNQSMLVKSGPDSPVVWGRLKWQGFACASTSEPRREPTPLISL